MSPLDKRVKLFFEETGHGEETIVFSHGLLFDHRMWHHLVAHFSSRYRCVAYDHRGQGKSELKPPFDMDTLYEDAAALIEQVSPGKPVHFVGLSMGGFVGMRLAARKPHLIKSLTLLDTSAEPEPNKFKYRVLSFIFKTMGPRPVSKRIVSILFGRSTLHDPSKRELVDQWRQTIEQYPASITAAVAGVIDRAGVLDEISSIRLPVQVLVGDEDVATVPTKSMKIHAHIPGSHLHQIARAGHSSCLEQPQKVNMLLENFFNSLKGG
jgi:3-oxoadipate enol-lactonase